MKVRYLDKEFEFDRRMPARRLLERLDILPETVVVTKNEEIVTEDEMLEVEDEVELIRVISGGAGDRKLGTGSRARDLIRSRRPIFNS